MGRDRQPLPFMDLRYNLIQAELCCPDQESIVNPFDFIFLIGYHLEAKKIFIIFSRQDLIIEQGLHGIDRTLVFKQP